MELSLGAGSILALAVSMALLAALPSTSVVAVTAQSAAYGFRHGAAVSAGVVAGDLIYILLALFGLALLVDAMGGMVDAIRYLGGLYLIWLGLRLWRSVPAEDGFGEQSGHAPSLRSGFATGLLITLGDQKAVLFYLGFLPAFMDLGFLGALDAAVIALVAVLAVGGVKLMYAAAVARARTLFGTRASRLLNRLAAGVMVAAGVFLLTRNLLSS